MKDETRRWRRVLDNKKNRNSHALELNDVIVTRLLSRISFLSRSFLSQLSSLVLLKGGRATPAVARPVDCERVRKKDEARQAQTENMATMVLVSGHHCMAASVLLTS